MLCRCVNYKLHVYAAGRTVNSPVTWCSRPTYEARADTSSSVIYGRILFLSYVGLHGNRALTVGPSNMQYQSTV